MKTPPTPPKLPLAHRRIREVLCVDLARGMECPGCALKAERLYDVVILAQRQERQEESIAALNRIFERSNQSPETD